MESTLQSISEKRESRKYGFGCVEKKKCVSKWEIAFLMGFPEFKIGDSEVFSGLGVPISSA